MLWRHAPDFAGYEDETGFLSENGVKGIKLHPEYQQFYPDDDKLTGLYEACAKNDLTILFHAGVDLGYTTVHCTPQRALQLLSIKGLKVVLAHMGGYKMWDDVEKYLAGKNVYFDLAYCHEMEAARLKRMILNHGSNKILFASDSPWQRAKTIKDKADTLNLAENDTQNIYYKNASRILQII